MYLAQIHDPTLFFEKGHYSFKISTGHFSFYINEIVTNKNLNCHYYGKIILSGYPRDIIKLDNALKCQHDIIQKSDCLIWYCSLQYHFSRSKSTNTIV